MKFRVIRSYDKSKKESVFTVELVDSTTWEPFLKYSTASAADALDYVFEQAGDSFTVEIDK